MIGCPAVDLSAFNRHQRIAVSFSGGKDSLAVVYLLRDAGLLERVVLYHMDTGDLLPETTTVVEHVKSFAPTFVHMRGDVTAWIKVNGLPTDLLPHSAHPVGQSMGEHRRRLVSRYDCCMANLMLPLYQRIVEDGNTLHLRGTKACDMARLPARTGDVHDGMEVLYPLEEWSNDQVFNYLEAVGAPISRIYQHVENSPECARCSAWWGEKRAAYLKEFHPALWVEYTARLRSVIDEIEGPLANLRREVSPALNAPHTAPLLLDAATDVVWDMGVRVLQGVALAPTEAEHVAEMLRRMAPAYGARILDIGSGFGEVARLMRLARPDLSFTMLNSNARQHERTPTGPGMHPVQGSMHDIPCGDNCFNGAMLLYALCHGDHARVLRQAARAVRPDGFLFVFDYERLGGDNWLTEQYLGSRFYPANDLEALALDAGWHLDTIEPVEGDDSLFRSLFADDLLYTSIFRDLRPTIWRFVKN